MSDFQEDTKSISKQLEQPTLSVQSTNVKPTKERHQHNGGVDEEVVAWDSEGNPIATRFRAVWECPLDAYRDFGLISKVEHKAGIEFKRVYYNAVLASQIDILPTTEAEVSKKPTRSETKLKQAYDAVPSKEMEVIVTVCGNNFHIQSATAYEKLRKGLGHLAVAWCSADIEVTEPHYRKNKNK